MEDKIIESIRLLIENKLSLDEKSIIINKIKKNISLKQEYVLQKELYKSSFIDSIRNSLSNKHKEKPAIMQPNDYIRTAAFADDEKFASKGLPITDETINDFLEDTDE